ncbi:hypothetical protein D082_20130 [Synechocystis sp. PCC 6714]|nr:hypothetical protein D082_20130 [Synechocystis sp. PCC 6714]
MNPTQILGKNLSKWLIRQKPKYFYAKALDRSKENDSKFNRIVRYRGIVDQCYINFWSALLLI